jgi:4-diphosphocytidyl-2-C-methyl-D-erythritol kinase
VLAWPGVALGTADVYARYRPPARARERVEELTAAPFAVTDPAQLAALVENDLAAAAEVLCPPTSALRALFLAEGALTACMSGSGSAVFGLYADERAAQAACERIAADVPWAVVARLPHGAAGATITV